MQEEKYLLFNWRKQVYALPIKEVVKTIGVEDIIKTSRDEIKVTLYNEQNLPVIDALAMFSIKETVLDKQTKILVIKKGGMQFGVLIDGVVGVEPIDYNEMEMPDINENRFVHHLYKNIKIINISYFLTPAIRELMAGVPNLDIKSLLSESDFEKNIYSDENNKDFIINQIKTEILNLLITSNNDKKNQYFSDELTRIHKMIENL